MIIAKSKPIEEVIGFIEGYEKVLVTGCGTCVSVCQVGGEKEVKILASALKLASSAAGVERKLGEMTPQRSCYAEFVEPVIEKAKEFDAVVSIACGVGNNFLAERLGNIPVFPGVDTVFLGGSDELGIWSERCQACGDCVLHLTGGICPIARCAKSILNGPCGGTHDGKCEISEEIDCAWYVIVERMKALGTLDKLTAIQPPKDWSKGRDGGQRKLVREDLRNPDATEAEEQPEGAESK